MDFWPIEKVLGRIRTDLGPTFRPDMDISFDEGLEALNTAVTSSYAKILPRLDTVLKQYSTAPLPSFHHRISSRLKDTRRAILASSHIKAKLKTFIDMEENLAEVGAGDVANEEGYEAIVNLVFDHVQPSFIQDVDDFREARFIFTNTRFSATMVLK